MAEKTKNQLEQELAEALAAKEAAEKKAEEALEAKEAAEKDATNSKLKTEELLKAAREAEKAADKEAEGFFKSGNNAVGRDAELVRVTIPKQHGKKASKDIVITVNGNDWQITRGVPVEIPRYVYEVYVMSEKERDEAEAFIESVTE